MRGCLFAQAAVRAAIHATESPNAVYHIELGNNGRLLPPRTRLRVNESVCVLFRGREAGVGGRYRVLWKYGKWARVRQSWLIMSSQL